MQKCLAALYCTSDHWCEEILEILVTVRHYVILLLQYLIIGISHTVRIKRLPNTALHF